MRAPLIPTLLLVLSTSFGAMAYAKDTLEDVSLALSVAALKAPDSAGVEAKTTMLINGLNVPVTISRDLNTNQLIITPIVVDGKIAATDKDGKAVSLDASAVPAKYQVVTTSTATGIKVTTMTIVARNGKTVTYANTASGFTKTAGDESALAGLTEDAPDAAEVPGDAVAKITVTKDDTYKAPDIVIQQESTNLTEPGDAANPSPSKQ